MTITRRARRRRCARRLCVRKIDPVTDLIVLYDSPNPLSSIMTRVWAERNRQTYLNVSCLCNVQHAISSYLHRLLLLETRNDQYRPIRLAACCTILLLIQTKADYLTRYIEFIYLVNGALLEWCALCKL